MANSIEFKILNATELEKSLGKAKSFSGDQPKKAVTAAELKTKLKEFQNTAAKAPAPETKLSKFTAVALKAKDVEAIRAIHESTTPTAEAIVGQKQTPERIVGTLFSSLGALEFTKMESEFKTRLKSASTPASKEKVQAEWANVVKAGVTAFSAAGLKNLNETSLRGFSSELSKSKANFNALVTIANTGVAVSGVKEAVLTSQSALRGGFVAETAALIEASVLSTSIANLCSRPFVQGTITKHFHKGFSLTVSIPYWCPTWTNPFRVCHKNFTLAGLSLDLDVQMGYRVTCCGAVVFGQASAQVCATVLGISVCAGCTARITGVAGIGRTGSGNNCTYGIGVNAQLTCTFAGVTILNVQAPFGFNVTGPCPPAGLC